MKILLLIALFLLAHLTACVGPHATTLRLFAAAQRTVEFHTYGCFGGNRSWALVDDVFIITSDDIHFRLKPNVASAAWRTIDELNIFAWKSTYAPEDIGLSTTDAAPWFVTVRYGAETKKTSGANAYPELAEPGTTVIGYDSRTGRAIRTACDALFDVLSALEKEAKANAIKI